MTCPESVERLSDPPPPEKRARDYSGQRYGIGDQVVLRGSRSRRDPTKPVRAKLASIHGEQAWFELLEATEITDAGKRIPWPQHETGLELRITPIGRVR